MRVNRLRKKVEMPPCMGSSRNPDNMTKRGTDVRHSEVMIPIQKVLLPVTTLSWSPM